MSVAPRGPINDWLWRSVKAGGTVTIPIASYDAQRVNQRHEFEIEYWNEEDGEVTLIAHREYKRVLEGHNALDTGRAPVPPADADSRGVRSVASDED